MPISKQELETQLKQSEQTISQQRIEIDRHKVEIDRQKTEVDSHASEINRLNAVLNQERHRELLRDIVIAVLGVILGGFCAYLIDGHFHNRTIGVLQDQKKQLTTRIDSLEGKIALPPVGPRSEEVYPNRTKAVVEKLLPDLKDHDRLMILNDFIGHEHYSNPKSFADYMAKLRDVHLYHDVQIDMVVGGPEAVKDMITDQFRREWWKEEGPDDKPGKSGKFGYWDLVDPNDPANTQRSFKRYRNYIDYYTHTRHIIDEDHPPKTYVDFLNTLTKTQKAWCDDLKGIATVKSMPYPLARESLHFWMIKNKKALFTFPAFSTLAIGEGRSFTAENPASQAFLEMLEHRFQALWEPQKHLALFRQQLNDVSWNPENDRDFTNNGACYENLFTGTTPQVARQVTRSERKRVPAPVR